MIWALAILGVTNITTLVVLAVYIYLENKEKAKTINALIAKNSQEYLNHELSDKMDKIEVKPQPDLRADMEELKDLSDDDFTKHIVNE